MLFKIYKKELANKTEFSFYSDYIILNKNDIISIEPHWTTESQLVMKYINGYIREREGNIGTKVYHLTLSVDQLLHRIEVEPILERFDNKVDKLISGA